MLDIGFIVALIGTIIGFVGLSKKRKPLAAFLAVVVALCFWLADKNCWFVGTWYPQGSAITSDGLHQYACTVQGSYWDTPNKDSSMQKLFGRIGGDVTVSRVGSKNCPAAQITGKLSLERNASQLVLLMADIDKPCPPGSSANLRGSNIFFARNHVQQ